MIDKSAALAMVAPEKFLSYPCLSMGVSRISPTAAVVAGPEPDSAPQNMQVSTATMARPPTALPTRSSKKRAMVAASPARSRITPASTKKGMASRGKEAMPLEKFTPSMPMPRSK